MLWCFLKSFILLGLTEEEPPVLQSELLLLAKEHEIIDNEDDMDDVTAVDSGDEGTDESDTSN